MERKAKRFWRMAACGVAGLVISIGVDSQNSSAQDDRPEGRREFRGERDSRGDRGFDGPRGPREGRPRDGEGPGFRAESPGPGGPGGGRGPQMMLRLPIIAALDANRDGEISEAEINNAANALKKLDHNKDGKIDLAEMRPDDFGPPGDRRPDEAGPRGNGPRPDGPRPDGPRPDGPRPEGPRADGPRPEGPRPDGQGERRMNDRGPGERGPGDRGAGDRGPRGGDQAGSPRGRGMGMMGRGGADPEQMLSRLLQQDKDGDGALSEDELPQWMSRFIERFDENSDQKLSKDELNKMMEARRTMGRDRNGPPRDGGGAPGGDRPRRPPAE
ncbi:hypothetical protein LOC67_19870 [Stieleria sp. JC731]|uniref:hypothetical protein n=1 Tax=Pirellulaceae TaxID=2691357 RepID=UPI001E59B2F8|nr:hypothetical protein [Stieleria sp. JC731]MCC9602815.1 hypothetical protein [Stieleria sp. JC731]